MNDFKNKMKAEGTIREETKNTYKEPFPNVTDSQWNDWTWQIKNSITNKEQLKEILSEDIDFPYSLPLRITPHYLKTILQSPNRDKLIKCVVPSEFELIQSEGESVDPLSEERDSVLPNLVHRYPDRVLLLVTGFCSANCRYCTRSRVVGQNTIRFNKEQFNQAIDYISSHPEVRDVLVSGGDPLTLGNDTLDYILSSIRNIPHVEIIRIGTKVPVVLPQRITPQLINVLKKHHPLFLSIHFTHPDEMVTEVKTACEKLADAGIPLGSQTVLLKGVNDDVDIMKELMHKLLMSRVRPYYLYLCDPIVGSSHFRTTIEKGLEIIKGLRGYTSGYAVPTLVVDAPGGGGKIPLLPDCFAGEKNNSILLKNFQGKIFQYPN